MFGCFVIMTYVDETTIYFFMALTSVNHFVTTFDELEKIEDDCEFCFETIESQVAYNPKVNVIWALFSTTIGQLNFVVLCPSHVRL